MTGDEERARYKKILSALPKAKGRRSLVLLSTGEALLAEYGEKDPVTGRYGSRVL